jgi:hypothetical protein
MLSLTSLFDEVVGEIVYFIPVRWLRLLCSIFLRRVYNSEENAELKGICKATGVEMYLLVCFNLLLDLFMGCSSGGAVVRAEADMGGGSKMMHFRTLDWDMPALRRIVVHLDYVVAEAEPIVASSITYVGFVGVLTGVRKDLSLSLNFRPYRVDSGKLLPDAKYTWHLLLVLFGRRASISSTLRGFLLPQQESKRTGWLSWLRWGRTPRQSSIISYAEVIDRMGGQNPLPSTACYLCFSNGQETTTIEKDRMSAVVHVSKEFIVVTNTDSSPPYSQTEKTNDESQLRRPLALAGIDDQEAKERQDCAFHNWANRRLVKARRLGPYILSEDDLRTLSEVEDIVELVQKFPTTNEVTHFACVMDPTAGTFIWSRRWINPISEKWIREHLSERW